MPQRVVVVSVMPQGVVVIWKQPQRVVAVSLVPKRVVVGFFAQGAFSVFERNTYIKVVQI
jgi:hypothetical protein